MGKSDYQSHDPRLHYILRVASHIFTLNLTENKFPNLNSIQDFCNTSTSLLIIAMDEKNSKIEISNEIRNDHANLTRVIFYKLKAAPLSLDVYKNEISVLSLRGRPTDVLIRSVEEVFRKAVSNDSEISRDESHHHWNINESVVISNQKSELDKEESLRKYELVNEEITYWKARKDSTALQYCSILKKMQIEKLVDCNINDINQIIDTTENCLDALWNCKPAFPQYRMEQLLHNIGKGILFYLNFV
ncbi:unnamed protein product [Thelazia callipaeda]|uniref:DHC_N1 domain-containing protein n=1 Tax=Thelazia callipaeda TaxID=103827 RepID=A0A0N5D8V1_THECL|nr:unnamed protein product [Thelazia callipaeda]